MKKSYLLFIACFFTYVASSQIIWSDDFESGIGDWTTIDADGDGNNWQIATANVTAASGTACAISYSWFNQQVLTPNNYFISPVIDLTSTTGTILVDWKAYAQDQTWANEHYLVIASTANDQASIDAGTVLYDGIVGSNGAYITETGNISSFAGGMVYITIIHNNSSDQFALNIDDVEVYTSNVIDLGVSNVSSPNHDNGCMLTNAENITATITNFGGLDATDFEVSYSVNGGTPVTETVSATVAPAGMYEHTFATSVDLSVLGEYSIEVSVSILNDDDDANNVTTLDTRNSDSQITVHVMSDVSGGHAWEITDNSTGQVVASRGAYQWNTEVFDNICVYSDRCYSFNYTGAMGAGAFLEILLDGQAVAGDTNGNGIAATIEYTAIGGGCSANEAAVSRLTFGQYQLLNSTSPITAEIKNFGAAAITEIVANYTIDGGTPISETFSGLNILQGGTNEISFIQEFNVATLAVSDVVVTIETVNGEMDDAANNVQDGKIIAMTDIPERKFIVEEGTGTWCPWCPRGTVGVETVTMDHDDAYGIAVHNDDPMDIGTYDSDLSTLVQGQGYPFSGVNRTFETDPSAANLEAAYQSEKTKIVPASLDITAVMDADSRELTVDVSANIFAVLMAGDYKVNVVLTEDDVVGTGAGFAQANNYAGGNNGPMGGYENLANPVPAADMEYDHVARMLMGGFDGDAGSFPSNATNTDSPTYQYTATISQDWDATRMHAIAMLIDMTNGGQIVNSIGTSIDVTVATKDLFQHDLVKIYPNPFSDFTNIELDLNTSQDVTVEVFNAVGQRVTSKDYGQLSGEMVLPFNASNLENGVYFIHIRLGETLVTKKVFLAR